MSDFDPSFATISDISNALETGSVSSVEVTEKTIARIKALDRKLNAFVCLTEERAIEEARSADGRRQAGKQLGALDGIPYAAKDIFDVANVPTMAGCKLLADNVADEDCSAVNRLSDAGMVLVGKTHTVQFAAHIDGRNPDFGTPHNPWNEKPHLPGGSSSGSAVAVAAGLVPMALGSDTAGSIRVPAALTGLTGFKPTGGRLGRGNVRPLSWSLDTIGPLTRTVGDALTVFDAMQGVDPSDETTWTTPMISFSTRNAHEISELRIAVCETVFFEQCDPQIKEAVEAVAAKLRELGATISRVLVPEIEETLARTQEDVVMATEAYAVNRDLLENYREALDPDCFWMEAGKNINGAEYYDAVRQRYHLQRRTRERLVGVDAILAPTTAHPAWPMGDTGTDRPPISYLRNTGIGNYLNLPSVSIPCGFTDKGLPVGVMISGKPFDDEVVLRIANAFQQATDWQDRTPDLSWTG